MTRSNSRVSSGIFIRKFVASITRFRAATHAYPHIVDQDLKNRNNLKHFENLQDFKRFYNESEISKYSTETSGFIENFYGEETSSDTEGEEEENDDEDYTYENIEYENEDSNAFDLWYQIKSSLTEEAFDGLSVIFKEFADCLDKISEDDLISLTKLSELSTLKIGIHMVTDAKEFDNFDNNQSNDFSFDLEVFLNGYNLQVNEQALIIGQILGHLIRNFHLVKPLIPYLIIHCKEKYPILVKFLLNLYLDNLRDTEIMKLYSQNSVAQKVIEESFRRIEFPLHLLAKLAQKKISLNTFSSSEYYQLIFFTLNESGCCTSKHIDSILLTLRKLLKVSLSCISKKKNVYKYERLFSFITFKIFDIWELCFKKINLRSEYLQFFQELIKSMTNFNSSLKNNYFTNINLQLVKIRNLVENSSSSRTMILQFINDLFKQLKSTRSHSKQIIKLKKENGEQKILGNLLGQSQFSKKKPKRLVKKSSFAKVKKLKRSSSRSGLLEYCVAS